MKKFLPLAMFVACVSQAAETSVPHRPNILVLLSDDQGYADYGFVSRKHDFNTPNLDSLAKEGTYFPNSLATFPICSPSRAGIMTGRYPQRWHDYWFSGDKRYPGIPAGVKTTAEYLREAGYVTGYIGKVHYDGGLPAPGKRTFPTEHGFDHLFGAVTPAGAVHYLLHSQKAIQEKGADYAAKYSIFPLWLNNEQQTDLDGFTTDLFADDAVKFIKEHAGKQPFYLHVAWNAVHSAVRQLPPEEAKRRGFQLDEEGNAIAPLRSAYLAQLELLDAGVGRILDALKQSGQLDNTLIIYTTDNGGTSGSSNWPLNGAKYHLYEGGVRCSMIARFPGRFAAGAHSEAHVSHLDILPTILEVAGVSPEPGTLDGTSLFGLAARPKESFNRPLFHETRFQWSVHEGNWKLLVTTDEDFADSIAKEYKLNIARGVNLFDLSTDPSEKTNLAPAHPEIVSDLTRQHDEWRKDCHLPPVPHTKRDQH